jgi:hypothetical protein
MDDSELAMNYGPAEWGSRQLVKHGTKIGNIVEELKTQLRPVDWVGGSRADYDKAQAKLHEANDLIRAAVVEAGDVVMAARVGVARIDGGGSNLFA